MQAVLGVRTLPAGAKDFVARIRPRRRRDDTWRRTIYGLLALAGTYGYFAFFTGISYWQGSRLLYPVEFALILIATTALVSLARVLNNWSLTPSCRNER